MDGADQVSDCRLPVQNLHVVFDNLTILVNMKGAKRLTVFARACVFFQWKFKLSRSKQTDDSSQCLVKLWKFVTG